MELGELSEPLTVAETAHVKARMAPHFLFVTAATGRPGINGRLLADGTK